MFSSCSNSAIDLCDSSLLVNFLVRKLAFGALNCQKRSCGWCGHLCRLQRRHHWHWMERACQVIVVFFLLCVHKCFFFKVCEVLISQDLVSLCLALLQNSWTSLHFWFVPQTQKIFLWKFLPVFFKEVKEVFTVNIYFVSFLEISHKLLNSRNRFSHQKSIACVFISKLVWVNTNFP